MEKKVHKAISKTEARILLILLVAFPLLLLFCLYLKQQELLTERSAIPRILLIGLAFLMGIVSLVSLWIPALTKMLTRLGLDPDRKGSLGNILFAIGLTITFIPSIAAIAWFGTRSEKMEMEALVNRGVIARKCITAYEYVSGSSSNNYYRYQYSFPVRSSGNNIYMLSIHRKHYTLKPGDSVDIIYLPADPEIFHEIKYMSGKPVMVRYR